MRNSATVKSYSGPKRRLLRRDRCRWTISDAMMTNAINSTMKRMALAGAVVIRFLSSWWISQCGAESLPDEDPRVSQRETTLVVGICRWQSHRVADCGWPCTVALSPAKDTGGKILRR